MSTSHQLPNANASVQEFIPDTGLSYSIVSTRSQMGSSRNLPQELRYHSQHTKRPSRIGLDQVPRQVLDENPDRHRLIHRRSDVAFTGYTMPGVFH